MCIVETNVDDVTGEILARTIEVSLVEGAFDATASPFTGKKGRPGFTVRLTCAKSAAPKFAQILVRETGTLGVKVIETERWIVNRRKVVISIRVGGKSRQIRLKTASIDGQTRFKPEYEDVKKVADEFNIPLRSVIETTLRQASERLET